MLLQISKDNLISAHFFFVDIVGLSDPKTSTKVQIQKIKDLNQLIKECESFKKTNSENSIKIPTGDGMVIAFFIDQQLPILLAIQLHKKILQYNKGKFPSEILQVRIGLHSGNSYLVRDINDSITLWGSGIVLARRVMDLGDANHILLTERMAKDLLEISDEYSKIIHEIENFVIKHGQTLRVYAAYGKDFGNSVLPKSGIMQGIREEFTHINKNTVYQSITINLKLEDPKTMRVKHSRKYMITNKSNEPIREVIHGIGTDVEKSLEELHVHVFDENKRQMKINKITVNFPYQKEFTTIFHKPVLKNQKKEYTLEYKCEEPERYYENNFMVRCPIFAISFNAVRRIKPKLFQVEEEKKIQTKKKPTIRINGVKAITTWNLSDIEKGDIIRIEW